MLERLGRLFARRRWYVIGFWVLLAALSLLLAPRVGSVLRAGGFSAAGLESEIAFERYQQDFGSPGSAVSIVFHSEELAASDPVFVEAARAALHPLNQLDYVRQVLPFWDNPTQVAPRGHTAYAAVVVDIDDERAHRIVPDIRAALAPIEIEMHVAGAAAFYEDIQSTSESDLRRAEAIGLPFALLALLLVFGSLVAAGVPVISGGVSVIVGLAAIFLLGQAASFSIFALNVVTLVGLGLGADYSLFLVSRFREELARGLSPEDAVAVTLSTAGRAVLFSGLAVMIGLSSLTMFEFMMLRSIGIGGTVVTIIAVLAATTLVPAILMVLGPNIDRGRVWRPRFGVRDGWARLARLVMRRAGLVFLLVGLFLLLMGAPLLRIRVNAPDAGVLTPDSESRQVYDLLSREFGVGHIAPSFIVARFEGGALGPAGIDTLYRLGLALENDPRVVRVRGPLNLDPRITFDEYRLLYADPDQIADPYAAGFATVFTRGDTVVMSIEPRAPAASPEARGLVDALREYRDRHGLDLLVGGGAAGLSDFSDRLYEDFPKAVALILLVSYVVLLFLFRSILLPLKAVFMNTLSLAASFGMLVLVFQDGWLANVFRFEPLGYVEATLPVLMFALLFGLSMDYEVFLLARVKEAHDSGSDNTEAVALGLERSGRVITSAAMVVIVVSLAFVTADIVLIKAVGLGAAVAIFIDATVVRTLLVPATMKLLGEWNWWAPGWLFRGAK